MGTHGSLVTTVRYQGGLIRHRRAGPVPEQAGKAMTSDDDFTRLDDPALLAERARVRDELQALTQRYEALSAEFTRRVAAQWTQ